MNENNNDSVQMISIHASQMITRKTIIRSSIILLILLFAIGRSWYGTQLDSFANDEPYHIVSGAYYVQTGDFRLNPEHPPLSKLWVGLWNQNNLRLRPFQPLDDKYHERQWLQEIMYYDNDDHLAQRQSRLAMYSFHFVLGCLIALLVWRIFGFSWAVVSMLWLALEPTVSAHQPIVLTDLPLSFTLLLTALTGGMVCSTWKWKWTVAFGLAIGTTLASKHSALPGLAAIILLAAVFALLPLRAKQFRSVSFRLGKLCIAGLLALFTLWASYGFQNHSSVENEDNFNRTLTEKIDDLNMASWQSLIVLMENLHIFPRAYLWGLADTVRAGVEGRGAERHMFFGKILEGRAPILYFPGVIISKVPIALLVLFFIAFGILAKEFYNQLKDKISLLNTKQWISIGFLFALIIAHLLALASGRTSYGGIRHALPVVAGLGIIAGGLTRFQFQRITYLSWALPAFLFGLTVLMTFREKRLWEYYNELVGGTENAYQYFRDEGLYLGQRFYETKAFFDQAHIDKKELIHPYAWYMEEEWKAEKMNIQYAVKDIYDENQEGIVEGYFLEHIGNFIPWPNWDPALLEPLEKVKRIGNIYILHGQIKDPKTWAGSMNYRVYEYIMEEENPDWTLVARRLRQTTAIIDWSTTSFIHLGNACLKIGEKDEALEAYEKAKINLGKGDPYEKSLLEHITLVKNAEDVTQLKSLRPHSIE